MSAERFTTPEIHLMEVEGITPTEVNVLKRMKDLKPFRYRDLLDRMGWVAFRIEVIMSMKQHGLIITKDESAHLGTVYVFTGRARKMVERLDECGGVPQWYRINRSNFGDVADVVRRRRENYEVKGMPDIGRRQWFIHCPKGPQPIIDQVMADIGYDPPVAHRPASSNTVKKKDAPAPLSRAELLAQGKPADVIRMLKAVTTDAAQWVRCKCKLYERERRLPEGLINEAREILGVSMPDCCPRPGMRPI